MRRTEGEGIAGCRALVSHRLSPPYTVSPRALLLCYVVIIIIFNPKESLINHRVRETIMNVTHGLLFSVQDVLKILSFYKRKLRFGIKSVSQMY
jgi:hypothetical protein